MGLIQETWEKIKKLQTPTVDKRGLEICLGITNCLLFGVGTIIAGLLANNLADVLIGVGQLCLPFVGWVWSIGWGVLMIAGRG